MRDQKADIKKAIFETKDRSSVLGTYSIDENVWGRSIECGVLEDPWTAPPARPDQSSVIQSKSSIVRGPSAKAAPPEGGRHAGTSTTRPAVRDCPGT